jgi:hypothetical protein
MRIILYLAITDFHFFSGSILFICVRAGHFGGSGSACVHPMTENSPVLHKFMEILLWIGVP